MSEWTRSNPWRQGSIIEEDCLHKLLGIENQSTSLKMIGVVVSHDCDIAQSFEREPQIEIIPAEIIEHSDGNCTHAKNARRLHLRLVSKDGVLVSKNGVNRWIEMESPTRKGVDKSLFQEFSPSTDLFIQRESIPILQRWLASRYRRAAFPDKFESALNVVKDKLTKILQTTGDHIRAVMFDVGDEQINREIVRFPLAITLVYVSEGEGQSACTTAEKACDDVTGLFEKAFEHPPADRDVMIELRACTAISDEAMSLRQADSLKEWRSEHISLRSSPPGPMI